MFKHLIDFSNILTPISIEIYIVPNIKYNKKIIAIFGIKIISWIEKE